MKIKIVPEEKFNTCKGCFFNKGSETYDFRCGHKKQVIDDKSVHCGDDNSIYKEEREYE